MSKQLFHLVGNGYAGRGVLVRMLSGTEKDEAYMAAALSAGEDTKKYVFLRTREGICRMIVGVTEPGKTMEQIRAEPIPPITQAELFSLDGPRRLEKLFCSKEIGALSEIFLRIHEATQTEVDAIMGKAIPMAEE